MTKKLPERLEHGYDDSGSSKDDIIRAVNSIIDYLKDKDFMEGLEKADTEEKKCKICSNFDIVTWCNNNVKEKYDIPSEYAGEKVAHYIMSFIATLPKPVEQELVPLDKNYQMMWSEICGNTSIGPRDLLLLETILSKYGVPKQEQEGFVSEEEALESINNWIKETVGLDTPINRKQTPTAFEKSITPTTQATSVIDVEKIHNDLWELFKERPVFSVKVKEYLSSLPIQKKRTREDIKKYVNPSERDSYDAGKVQGIEEFARHIGILSD